MNITSLVDRADKKRGNADTESVPSIPKRQRSRTLEGSGGLHDGELDCEDYTVGWVCALPIEMAAAIAMLDRTHQPLPKKPGDNNEYSFGNIGLHNIVIACLPSGHYGTINAAVVANNMSRSFPSLETRLMVGIGGGVPLNADVRLGDVVVGHDVLQYDFGKTVQGGKFHRTSNLVKPPHAILTAVASLRTQHELSAKLPLILSETLDRNPTMERYKYPNLSKDRLFHSSYEHDELRDNCDYCDQSKLHNRPPRPDTSPRIHYGTIASGNQVMKHGETRDNWSRKENVLCFEMEAAGLMDHFPCLVIRGICDYCDSHKNKQWQPYAAVTAAAYAKELLCLVKARPPESVPVIGPNHEQVASAQIPHVMSQQQKQEIMDSLGFEQINSRRLNIRSPHRETCEWFLTHHIFLKWKDPTEFHDHNGFLWLKGNPGTGKSTIMKYLVKNSQKEKSYDATLNFFFNARGHDLEKTTLGMYRALLLQLFQQLPYSKEVLDRLALRRKEQYKWTIEVLEELFEQTIEKATHLSIVCFVDALDECQEDDIRSMLSFFEKMTLLSSSANGRFSICFSSRHYPHITMKEGFQLEIVLEDQKGHGSDITRYITSELNIGHSKLALNIKTELHRKASGIFMWAVLVVKILNRERDHGRLHNLYHKLQEIPPDLHDLFNLILAQKTDTDGRHNLLCFQWILFARVPLTPEELYSTIMQRITGSIPDPSDLSREDIRLFILEYSKGLAEITKSEPPTVQFIHESVRDFLLEDGGLRSAWPGLGSDIIGKCHNKLRDFCLEYLTNGRIHQLGHTRKPQPLYYGEARKLLDQATRLFPFLEYAIRNIFFHADTASSYGISQTDFLVSFPLKDWISLDNIFDMNWVRQSKPTARLSYILAEANASHLIQTFPSLVAFVEVKDERYGCPLLAALVNDADEVIELFRAKLLEQLPPNTSFRDQFEDMRQQMRQQISKLQRPTSGISFTKSRSLISHLAEYNGTLDLFALFVEYHNLSLENRDNTKESSKMERHGRDHISAATKLVKTGQIDPHSRDRTGRTPLSWAAQGNNIGAIKILLESAQADPDSKDNNGQTPLSWAARHGCVNAVQILLKSDQVNADLRDNDGRTPLSLAAGLDKSFTGLDKSASRECVEILLRSGRVSPDSRDNRGRSPLSWATGKIHSDPETMRLLLQCSFVSLTQEIMMAESTELGGFSVPGHRSNLYSTQNLPCGS